MEQEFCDDLQELTGRKAHHTVWIMARRLRAIGTHIGHTEGCRPGNTVMAGASKIRSWSPNTPKTWRDARRCAIYLRERRGSAHGGQSVPLDGLGLTVFAPYDWA
jgi:hypothetical protein